MRQIHAGMHGLILVACMVPVLGSGGQPQTVTDGHSYNEGTRKLHEGDFTEAEMLLYSAVRGNDPRVQPTALYNLGLARFAIGVELLEDGPDARTVGRNAVASAAAADGALQAGLTAMQQGEQQALIRAYLRGRGAARRLNEARKALQEALNVCGTALSRWQRASGDFHSTAELAEDPDAVHNADVVDRHIARLVDSIQQMQSMMEGMQETMQGLQEMLEGLRGMIPDDLGEPGPGEDGEDWPEGLREGMEEGRGSEGREIPISPEDAQRLLESFQLDRGHTLPMGFEEEAEPKDRTGGKDW